jgi:xylulose-5-phosphate/fructose-6-phosphate phosphoketolase
MVVLNGLSRYHLVIEALRRTRRPPDNAELLVDACHQRLREHAAYVRTHFEDLPDIQQWTWS